MSAEPGVREVPGEDRNDLAERERFNGMLNSERALIAVAVK